MNRNAQGDKNRLPRSDSPFLWALTGGVSDRPPFWLMRQAGRYLPEYREVRSSVPGFLDLCLTPKLAAEVTLQPIRRFAMDAAIVFSDILMVPFGLGQSVEFHEGPVLKPVRNQSDLGGFGTNKFAQRLEPVYEALRLVRGALPNNCALIGFAGSPWTVATYMVEGGTSRDFFAVKSWAFTNPDEFQALIDLLIESTAGHLIAQVEAGADALQLFDTWAGVLPESFARRFVLAPTKAIVARVKAAHPDVPIIGFPRGLGALYRDYALEAGVDAVSLDASVPVGWAAQEIQSQCCVQGNLDPQILVAGGEILRSETRRIIAGFAGGPFVFNLGHGILPQTPPEHVAELARLIRGA